MSVFSWASNLLDSVDSSAQETIQQQLNKAKANKTPIYDRHAAARVDSQTPAPASVASLPTEHSSASPTSFSSSSSTISAPSIAAVPSLKGDKSPRRAKRVVQQLPSTPPSRPAFSPPLPPEALEDETASSHASAEKLVNGHGSVNPATSPALVTPSQPPIPEHGVEEDGSVAIPQSPEPNTHSSGGDNSNSPITVASATSVGDAAVTVPPPSAAAPSGTSRLTDTDTSNHATDDGSSTHSTPTAPPIAVAAAISPPPTKAKKASAAASLLTSASAAFSTALASAASSSSANSASSSSSSASSTAPSSTSSASSEAVAEIASLRAVWNESREQLAKAKKLLALKEESHSKALQQLSHDWQTAMDAQQAEYEEKARRLQETMDRQTADFQQAMATRKEYAMEQTAKEAEQKDTIEQLQQRLQAMEEKQQQLMDEREQMMNMHSAALSSHQTLLARLRAEEAERMLSLEAEMKAKTSSFAHRQDRDTSQEEEQIQYTQIAARLQRELEDKTRQLDRVMAEKRWIEADQQSLNDQLTTMKARVDEQHKQLQALQSSARERALTHSTEISTLKQQLTSQQQQLHSLEQHNTALQQQLQDATTTAASSASTRPDGEWEERLRGMTEHLMSKSTQIDRLSAERTALSVQLDDVRSRLVAFERQAKKDRERTLEDMEAGSTSAMKGMASNGDILAGKGKVSASSTNTTSTTAYPAVPELTALSLTVQFVLILLVCAALFVFVQSVAGRGVVHAVSALDRLGAMTGQMLRRYAWVRVSFAAYVFVIHVWVIFILFHLIGEMEGAEQSSAAAGASAVGNGVAVVSNVAAAANSFVRSRSHQLGNG